MSANHHWKFFRAGGFDQVRVESGHDLLSLDQLDQKLWVALACPTTGLEFDSRTLALIDTDKDARIRAPELIEAARWAASCLKNPDDLMKSGGTLSLSAINDSHPEGQQLLASARQILKDLGKPDSTSITLEDTSDTAKIFAQTHFNGDGIIPADAASDDAIKAVIADIIGCYGLEMDRSGKPGVNQPKVDLFFAEAQAYSDWWKKAETDPEVLPLGDKTSAAAQAIAAVKTKVDDYFARCRLAAFDLRALNALNREEKEYLAFAAKDLTITSTEIAALPLAVVGPNKPLPLDDAVNPAWADTIAAFRATVVTPLLGSGDTLTDADWKKLVARFLPYQGWGAAKAGTAVEKLGLARVRAILAGKGKEEITALIAKDKALEPEANSIAAVEKLVRFHRDIFRLSQNFVSFKDFYGRKDKAIFQAGTLFLDQRACDLCVKVEDPAKHALMAGLSGTYLAYCDLFRKGTGEKNQIVAAFTNGDSDNLMVGRNGIFYDRKGRDWDATITRIVDNPISIRQAFWAPYKKVARMIEEQIAKRAANADAAATTRLTQAAARVEKAADGTQPPPEPQKTKVDPGMIAALSVGAAGLGGMLGGIISGFLNLRGLMPIGIIAIILIISGPSMLLAWLKLRKRNLGPILDANGWAVNARARINLPFGASLTKIASLPLGSHPLVDPFAEKKSPWRIWLSLIVLVLLALGWWQGKIDRYLPSKIKSTTVLGTNAPGYMPNVSSTNAVQMLPPPK